MEEKSQNPFLIPAAIIVAGVLIAFAIIYTVSAPKKNTEKGTGAVTASEAGTISGDLTGDGQVLGNPAALVVIVEFADFQCPFCGRFFKEAEPKIIENYVRAGKAKFVYRDFAFLGPESEWAASASRCAADQNKFWEYHDYLFSHQNGENQGAFSKDNLKRFAAELKLNSAGFNDCLDKDKYLEAVRKSTAGGQSLGVNGTPATFINGQLTQGAVPYERFQSIIEEKLKNSR